MGMETAALFAWSTGRILVLPAKARLYLVSKASKAHGPFDFYDLDLIRNSGGVTSTEAYLKERTGSPSVSGCGDEHLAALAEGKKALRLENEEYIREHPELRGAIRLLMAKLLDDTPEDLQQYVCEFFTDPELERKVEEFMLQKV